ncbi:MAG: RNA polymerase factor sigma-54 [Cellvibrionales bacterium]|nr:RNA polymerase factor sigma-54 [Cellvibrionales bacterium]
MKQSLQIKLGQQLKMTPQLQQAIKLLQLSTLDLQHEIQEALDSNPLLEVAEDTGINDTEQTTTESESARDTQEFSTAELSTDELWEQNTIPNDLSIDAQWEEIYQPQNPITPVAAPQDADNNFDYKTSSTETLQDHLFWQLNLTQLVESDRAIALAIIDAISPTGFLSVSKTELFEGVKGNSDLEIEEFEAVRQLIMEFDPLGCGSENLQECLDFQLSLLPEKTPFLNDAKVIVKKYLPLLGNHDYAQLRRKTRLKENRLKSAIELIQSLQPTPGESIESEPTEYITPDVFVKKIQNRWVIELNNDFSPPLTINQDYANLVKRADNSDENNFLKERLQDAKWFIKSLQSRNDTLMKVAAEIVEQQIGFLEYGEEAMKPLVLHDIAQSIGMHESTISRVTTRKYIHTPRGTFELKYFFSSHVGTQQGGECSSTAIRAMIKKLIASEDAKKPLSDNKIANLLSEKDINVARRTVAKYRESLSIPPSNERKRL